jgi:tetratricopeptide (TPR) repeat protein
MLIAKNNAISQRSQAEKHNAAENATDLFEQAERLQNEAEQYSKNGEYDQATNSFSKAGQLYAKAGIVSEKSLRILEQDIRSLQKKINQTKAQINTEHRLLNEFQEASSAESVAESKLKSGNLAMAKTDFEHASNLYMKLIEIRKNQLNQIKNILKLYEKALKGKDINMLASLYLNFPDKIRNQWTQAFDTMESIEATLIVNDIEYISNGAIAVVEVSLRYSGYTGSDSNYKWDIEFTDQDGKLLITSINQN